MATKSTSSTDRRVVPVRLEPTLHHQVTLMARLADMSINDLIRAAIRDKLAALQQDTGIRQRATALQQAIAEDAKAQADALASSSLTRRPRAPDADKRHRVTLTNKALAGPARCTQPSNPTLTAPLGPAPARHLHPTTRYA